MAFVRNLGLGQLRSTTAQAGVGGGAGAVIQVLGVREAIAKFGLIGSVVGRQVGYMTYATARRVHSGARARVHKVTGNLYSGIQLHKLALYTWMVTASSRDGTNPRKNTKEYGGFVEYGTSRMSARPFMRPAAVEGQAVLVAGVLALAREVEVL